MFKKILVPLDGSSLAEQVVSCAADEAAQHGGKLVLLRITALPADLMPPGISGYIGPGVPIYVAPGLLGYTPSLLEEIEREDDQATAYLEGIAQPLREKGLDVEVVTLQGNPGQAIIDYANDNQVDLIVLATCGHGGLRRLVFGSVADFVLKESALPLLVIKPKSAEPQT